MIWNSEWTLPNERYSSLCMCWKRWKRHVSFTWI